MLILFKRSYCVKTIVYDPSIKPSTPTLLKGIKSFHQQTTMISEHEKAEMSEHDNECEEV
jgi:hypothetical protein